MHVLITPDRFAGAGTTQRIGEGLAAGWLRGAGHDTVDLCPLSDGGPGFVSLLAQVCGWPQPDPDGVLLVGATAYLDASVALTADPRAGSRAVGAQLARAVEAGASRVVVALGAPTDVPSLPDAGTGFLAALGLGGAQGGGVLVDVETPQDVTGFSDVLARVRGVDLVAAVATDIPLLGLHGASAGAADAGWASREAAQESERATGHLADVLWRAREQALSDAAATGWPGQPVALPLAAASTGAIGLPSTGGGAAGARARDVTGLPGAGAGGGLGFALALLGARLLPGAEVYAQLVGLTARAQAADLVIAARQDLDGASFHGSGIEQAAQAASNLGVACVALAERSMMNRRELAAVGLSASYPLTGSDADTSALVEQAEQVAERVARSWSPAWSE